MQRHLYLSFELQEKERRTRVIISAATLKLNAGAFTTHNAMHATNGKKEARRVSRRTKIKCRNIMSSCVAALKLNVDTLCLHYSSKLQLALG